MIFRPIRAKFLLGWSTARSLSALVRIFRGFMLNGVSQGISFRDNLLGVIFHLGKLEHLDRTNVEYLLWRVDHSAVELMRFDAMDIPGRYQYGLARMRTATRTRRLPFTWGLASK